MAIPDDYILDKMTDQAWKRFAEILTCNLKHVDIFSKIGPIGKPMLDNVKIGKLPDIEIKPYD